MEHLKKISISRKSKVWISIFFFFGIVYFGFPIYWIAISATKSASDFGSTNALFFGNSFQLFENMQNLFTAYDGIFLRWMLNSLIYAGGGAVGVALISAFGGYALSKLINKGGTTLAAITIGLIMVPANTFVLPLLVLFAKVDLAGTMWSVFLPTLPSPLGIFLVKYYADRQISNETLAAARLDRATELRIFLTIALPILRPMIGTVFLISLIANSNLYFLPQIMLNDPMLYPVTVGIGNRFGGQSAAIGIFVAMLPLLIAFMAVQRNWEKGLVDGQYR